MGAGRVVVLQVKDIEGTQNKMEERAEWIKRYCIKPYVKI